MQALEAAVRGGRTQELAALLEPRLVAAASAPLPGVRCKSTVLHLACELGEPGCVQLLASWAPQALHARTRTGCTPLLLCCAHERGRAHCEGVRILARAGAPLDAQRKSDGASAAHLCAGAGCAQCLQLMLIKAPQLLDARDRNYRSVLHAAAACAQPDAPACVSLLLREGAQLEGCTSVSAGMARPLHGAALRGKLASVRLLLLRRADVNARDGQRSTPLHVACAAGRPRAVRALLRAGANPHALDGQGCAPLQAAVRPLLSPPRAAAADVAVVVAAAAAGEAAAALGCAWCGARRCAWAGVAQRADALALLIEAGAAVSVQTLRQLRLGCHEVYGALARGGARGVPSLYALSQQALCNALAAEEVLAARGVAHVLGAARLGSECERMIVLNFEALRQGGAFDGAGVDAAALLREILVERVARLARRRADDGGAEADAACCECPSAPPGAPNAVEGDEDEDEGEEEADDESCNQHEQGRGPRSDSQSRDGPTSRTGTQQRSVL